MDRGWVPGGLRWGCDWVSEFETSLRLGRDSGVMSKSLLRRGWVAVVGGCEDLGLGKEAGEGRRGEKEE